MITTGSVPYSVRPSLHPKMPAVTDVGQSGPPHKHITLSRFIPGCIRMWRIAFTRSELIPIIERTPTRYPNRSPISFCCSADEKSLSMKQMHTAYSSPSQNPPSHPS